MLCRWRRVLQCRVSLHVAMWHFVAPCGATCRHVALCRAMWRYMSPCGPVSRHVALHVAMWHCVTPCGAICRHVALCRAMWRHMSPCGTVSRHVAPCCSERAVLHRACRVVCRVPSSLDTLRHLLAWMWREHFETRGGNTIQRCLRVSGSPTKIRS
eukprot:gene3408-biopygen9262